MLLPCRIGYIKYTKWVTSVISYLLTYAAVQPDVSRKSCAVKRLSEAIQAPPNLFKLIYNHHFSWFFHGFSMVFSSISWTMHWKKLMACQAAPLLDCFSGQEASLFPEHLCCDAEQWPPSGWWKCGWAFGMKTGEVNHNRTKYHGWLVSHVGMGQNLSLLWGNNHPFTSYICIPSGYQGFDP